MDKNTEQKLKRIWCERLVIGLFASTALGFFVAKIPVVYSLIQVQRQVQALTQVQRWTCERQGQTQMWMCKRQDLTQVQLQALTQVLTQAQVQALTQALTQAQVQALVTPKLTQAQVQALVTPKMILKHWAEEQMDMVAQALVTPKMTRQQMLTQMLTQALTDVVTQAQGQVVAQAQAFQQQFMLLGISALCFIIMLLLLLRQRNQISLPLTGQLIIVLPEECIADLEALHQQIKSEERSAWVIRKIMLWSVLELLWALHIQINFENLLLPKSKGHNKIDD